MFKRVDIVQEEIKGFSYLNKNDIEERVRIDTSHEIIEIQDNDGSDLSRIYFQDIPNLIKALQAAYDKVTGED